MIHSGEIPIQLGLFVNHGIVPAPHEDAQPRFNRSFEYDGLGDLYARFLIDELTSPSQAAVQAEEVRSLQEALNAMNETDREVLALRHFEQLTNNQVAEILGLSVTAASNRYLRAAARLGEILKHRSLGSISRGPRQ